MIDDHMRFSATDSAFVGSQIGSVGTLFEHIDVVHLAQTFQYQERTPAETFRIAKNLLRAGAAQSAATLLGRLDDRFQGVGAARRGVSVVEGVQDQRC
jgi:hypothetical protein